MKFNNRYLNELDGDGSDLGGDIVEEEQEFSIDGALERLESEQSTDEVVEEPLEQVEESEEALQAEPEQDFEAFEEELRAGGEDKKAQQFGKLRESNNNLAKENEGLKHIAENYQVLHDELFVHAGLNPDTLTDLVTVFESVKSGQPTPQAQQIAMSFVQRLSSMGFIDADNLNPFSNYPQIQQMVDNLEMTPEAAKQHIQLMERNSAFEQQHHQASEIQRQQQAFEGDKQQAMQQVQGLSNQYKSNNADHEQIESIIKDGFYQWAAQNPPNLWAGEYQRLYNLAAESIKFASNQQKSAINDDSLDPNGKTPAHEIPAYAEDGSNMIDRALAHAKAAGDI